MKEEDCTPKGFWKLYSEMLNDSKDESTTTNYHNDLLWTNKIIKLVTNMLRSKLRLETQNEYFRIDVIGFTTNWEEENTIAKQRREAEKIEMHPLHNWKLKVAYEHENSDDWSDELCKLCHVAADLKVISSYFDFKKEEDIEETLKYYIKRLNSEGTLCRAEGKWLFVFGPRKKSGDSFKAYTLDDNMNVIPLPERKMSFLSSNS